MVSVHTVLERWQLQGNAATYTHSLVPGVFLGKKPADKEVCSSGLLSPEADEAALDHPTG